MKEQPEMLAKVNAAIQRVAEENESALIKELVAVQLDNTRGHGSVDYLFGATLDVFATAVVSGAEIHRSNSDNELQEYMRVKIRHSMYDMIALLEDELEKLR